MKKQKLLIVVNDLTFFLTHRLEIAKEAVNQGFEVHVATPQGNGGGTLDGMNFSFHTISLSRRGKNPLQEILAIKSIYNLFKQINPDIVHLVTIKPILYGGIAARMLKLPAVVAAVSGLGSTFTSNGILAAWFKRAIIRLYRVALKQKNLKVIFQNEDDRQLLVQAKAVAQENTIVLRGSGVDLNKYIPVPENLNDIVVLMVSRLLSNKGVIEFIAAAKKLKQSGFAGRFLLVGEPDYGNPAFIDHDQINQWKKEGYVEVLGFREDIPELMASANLVVLPSYREGLPKVLIEAAACARAVITTDTPGCRDAIIPNQTGLLVPIKDANALADAINYLMQHSDERQKMGTQGRQLAEQDYSITRIVQAHMDIYKALCEQQTNTKPIKIVHIITGLAIGGAEQMLKRLLLSDEKAKDSVLIISLTSIGKIGTILQDQGFEVHAMNMHNFYSAIKGFCSLVKILYRYKPNVTQTWMYHADLIGGIAAKLVSRQPVIWNIRSTYCFNELNSTRLIMRACGLLSAWIPKKIICVAESAKFVHTQLGYQAHKMVVIPNGYNFANYNATQYDKVHIRKQLNLPLDKTIILSVGRYHAVKGQDIFIRAGGLLKNNNNTVLVLVGRGCDKENEPLKKLIEEHKLESSVILYGERDDVPLFLAAADIFCMPSRSEGFPNGLAEAMAMGLPCVASDVGDTRVLTGIHARLVQSEDPEILAQALESFINMTNEERLALGKNAANHVRQFFSIEKARNQFESVYRESLGVNH